MKNKYNEKYCLYFEGVSKYGKHEIYPILIGRLDLIDMYTCFCKDAKELYEFLPTRSPRKKNETVFEKQRRLQNPEVRGFIEDNFSGDIDLLDENSDKYIGKHFYIRAVPPKRIRTSDFKNMEVLYRKDRDVVYINKLSDEDEILNILAKRLLMTPSEYNLARTKSINTVEVQELRIKLAFFVKVIKDIQKRNPSLISIFNESADLRGDDYADSIIYNLAVDISNINLVVKEARRDPLLKRQLVLNIKDTLKKIDDLNNTKTRLLLKSEVVVRENKRYDKLYFSLEKIKETMRVLLEEETNYFNKRNKLDDKKEEKKTPLTAGKTDDDAFADALEKLNAEYVLTPEEEKEIKDGDFEDFMGPEVPGDTRFKRY